MRGGTPAIAELEAAGASFTVRQFDPTEVPDDLGYGRAAAAALGVDPDRVFKTLLVRLTGGASAHAVGIVPVSNQLSLKAIAASLGAKRADMLEPDVAERLTGYVVGGISPFGQRKRQPTVIDETCGLYETILVSGGKRGLDIEIAATDLVRILAATVAPIAG